ncbi:zwei Ig domain protein zig-1-like isoform X2 [Parambassis ranga]|uniref:Zwei Ig domain protein zig-1-like isoform X2 n=1 Tax=Parambassis ranga TaxID=210632 RepID=A0A6P7HF97_9TELE|nr:zwei Ig domain protein zig-1-like isoform X2 [Parambassis ranga]
MARLCRTEAVFRGESVTLTCNISMENVTFIKWTRGRPLFTYSMLSNQTFSNFSSDRLKIDVDFPSTLNITNVQLEDAGIYSCEATDRIGTHNVTWNLTVSENPEEESFPWYFVYLLPSASAFLLCVIMSAVCLCRKHRTVPSNQDAAQPQFYSQSGEAEGIPQGPRNATDYRTNNKQSQYMERLNSIYGHL